MAEAAVAGGLMGLMNKAGVDLPGPIELIALNDLRQQSEINVVGLGRVTQAFLPLIR